MSRPVVSSSQTEGFSVPQRPLRRLTFELFVVIALKLMALVLIWWLLFAAQPQPDVSPGAIVHRFAPTSSTPPEAHP